MPSKFTLSKSLKALSKIDNIYVGTYDPYTWLSTGNYALNYFMAQRFDRSIPFGKVIVLAGESGAGKSYISASIAREAQQADITTVFFDTEGALDEKWLKDVGIKPGSENGILRIEVHTINKLAEAINPVIQEYKENNKGKKAEDKQKLLFIVDSLGMLSTDNAVKQYLDSDLKGDMGHKPKALKALITQLVADITGEEICIIMTNHTYESQDQYNPAPKVSGGSGPIYAASIIIGMKKVMLTNEKKGKDKVNLGITARCNIIKSRYAKPNEVVEIDIPFDTGLDPYSGLVDFFIARGAIVQSGSWFSYTDLSGKEHKQQGKNFP